MEPITLENVGVIAPPAVWCAMSLEQDTTMNTTVVPLPNVTGVQKFLFGESSPPQANGVVLPPPVENSTDGIPENVTAAPMPAMEPDTTAFTPLEPMGEPAASLSA
jgi:hypothetical protein